MQIVDANVLLYAVNERSEQHDVAKAWLEHARSGSETVGFSWMVLLAFVRLTTHPALFPDPLSIGDAATIVRAWPAQPTAVVVEATARHIDVLEDSSLGPGNGRQPRERRAPGSDGTRARADIVSFDVDFSRFEGIRWLTPGA